MPACEKLSEGRAVVLLCVDANDKDGHSADASPCSPQVRGQHEEVPDDFLCPITRQLFRDPVQDMFGHTYERSAILAWLSKKGTCPMTRKPMKPSELIPNYLMGTKVELWKHPQQPAKESALHPGDSSETIIDEETHCAQGEKHQHGSHSSNKLFTVINDENHDQKASSEAPRMERLLEEYDRIIQDDEDWAKNRQRRRRRNRRRENREEVPRPLIFLDMRNQ